MTSHSSGDMTPAEAAHVVVETLLELVVAALLVTGATTLVGDAWPADLVAATVALAVGTGILWNRVSHLGARVDVSRGRAARQQAD